MYLFGRLFNDTLSENLTINGVGQHLKVKEYNCSRTSKIMSVSEPAALWMFGSYTHIQVWNQHDFLEFAFHEL